MTTPVMIGIAGGTGSGKTTIANQLFAAIPEGKSAVIEHDAYYKDAVLLGGDPKNVNYDHPSALDTEMLASHLQRLRSNEPIQVPIYDFVSHRRKEETKRVEPAPIVIVEGILVLAEPSIRENLDIKIFVDTDADIRLIRRIRRDIEQRGRNFDSVRNQYYETVRPMHIEFVEPSKKFADIIIPEGGNNHVAIDILLGRLREVVSDPEWTA